MNNEIQEGSFFGWFGDGPFRSKVISDVLVLRSNGLSANSACKLRPLSAWLSYQNESSDSVSCKLLNEFQNAVNTK